MNRRGSAVPKIRPDGCVTPNEAGARLGMTGEAIKSHIRHGNLRAAKAKNGYFFIREADLEEFVAERKGKGLEFKFHGKG